APGTRSGDAARQGFAAELSRDSLGTDEQRGRAVVEPRRVAGGHAALAVGAERGLEPGENLDPRVRTNELVLIDALRRSLPLRNVQRCDLLGEAARAPGRRRLHLRPRGE